MALYQAPCPAFRVPIFTTLCWIAMMMMLRKWSDSCVLITPASQQQLQPPHWIFSKWWAQISSELSSVPLLLHVETSGDDCDIWDRCWYLRTGTRLCVQSLRLQPSSLLRRVCQPAGLKHDRPFYNKLREALLQLHLTCLGIPAKIILLPKVISTRFPSNYCMWQYIV